jgi:hypothetical protein
LVPGIDTAAIRSCFQSMLHFMSANDITLVLTNVKPEIERLLMAPQVTHTGLTYSSTNWEAADGTAGNTHSTLLTYTVLTYSSTN